MNVSQDAALFNQMKETVFEPDYAETYQSMAAD